MTVRASANSTNCDNIQLESRKKSLFDPNQVIYILLSSFHIPGPGAGPGVGDGGAGGGVGTGGGVGSGVGTGGVGPVGQLAAQSATHFLYAVGSVGHCAMHFSRVPPGHVEFGVGAGGGIGPYRKCERVGGKKEEG
jgi:hypothetical protein